MTKKPNSARLAALVKINAICLLFGFMNGPHIAHSQKTFDLIHQVSKSNTISVNSQIQYSGSVIVDKAGQEENQTALPLEVRGNFKYAQRISNRSADQPQAIRYFTQAKAAIKAGSGKTASELNESNRLLLTRIKSTETGANQLQIASISGTLQQKEYELLKNPGDPLSFINLFDKTNVFIGDKWQMEHDAAASFLAIDRVISDSLTMNLKSVEAGIAKIYIYGDVRGEVDDTFTDMKVKAIVMLNLQAQMVTSLRVSIEEERRAGQLAPGFEGKFKMEAKVKSIAGHPMLSKEKIASVMTGKKIKLRFLFDRPDSEFQLYHHPQWRVIASEDEAVVLRYIDEGQMLAQCNVVQLPNLAAQQPLSLKQYKAEVGKIIAESEARIVDAKRFNSNHGYDVLKVSVDGFEAGLPFQWLYYHVASNDGRRVTFVVTLQQSAAEYLAGADQKLVESVLFKESVQREARLHLSD